MSTDTTGTAGASGQPQVVGGRPGPPRAELAAPFGVGHETHRPGIIAPRSLEIERDFAAGL